MYWNPAPFQCRFHRPARGQSLLVEDRVKVQTVTVEDRLDGSLHIRHQQRSLCYREILHQPRNPSRSRFRGLARGDGIARRQITPGEVSTKDRGQLSPTVLRFSLCPGVICRHLPNSPEPTLVSLKNPMIPDIHKPDISTLVRRGHFYFGWTKAREILDCTSRWRYSHNGVDA